MCIRDSLHTDIFKAVIKIFLYINLVKMCIRDRGSNALSSLNIVYQVINVEIAISTMLGTGGNAIISKYLGEEKNERAREALTQFVVLALLLSLVLLLFSELFLTPISRFLGASDVLLALSLIHISF